MTVLDTSAILAVMDCADADHEAVVAWIEQEPDDVVTTPLATAEVDHLVRSRGGPAAAAALGEDLASGAYLVDWWPEAMAACARVAWRYADAGLGLTDASLVVLAERVGTVRIATLDERHLRAIEPLAGGAAFELLPADL